MFDDDEDFNCDEFIATLDEDKAIKDYEELRFSQIENSQYTGPSKSQQKSEISDQKQSLPQTSQLQFSYNNKKTSNLLNHGASNTQKKIVGLLSDSILSQEMSSSLLSSPFSTSTPHDSEESYQESQSQRTNKSASIELESQGQSSKNSIRTSLYENSDESNESQTSNGIFSLRPGSSQTRNNFERSQPMSKIQSTANKRKAQFLDASNESEINKTNTESEQILKRKQHEAFSNSNNSQSQPKKACQMNTNSLLRMNSNLAGPSTSSMSKINRVLSIFDDEVSTPKRKADEPVLQAPKPKKAVCFAPEIQEKEIIRKPLAAKIAKISREKKAVARTFPGPAGLLPANLEDDDVIDVDRFDENGSSKKENKMSNFCSQNTKNLFSSGAWKLMMDDLPGSVELLDIETVKNNAFLYKKKGSKIPYLAAVISQIDYRQIDAHVVLKDISDDINGQIHHSVVKQYSSILGCGLVILLKDAAVVVTSKKHVCILISSKSLVGIYSDDERLVETPLLKKIQTGKVETELGDDIESWSDSM